MLQFKDLRVWQKGMELAEHIYCSTEKFPRSETYGLASQMRRAAVSIASNVAEGKAIGGQNYPRHVKLALGSEAELQTQIELARRLKMLDEDEALALLQRTSAVGQMLVALLNSLPRTNS